MGHFANTFEICKLDSENKKSWNESWRLLSAVVTYTVALRWWIFRFQLDKVSTLSGFFAAGSSGIVLWKISFSLRKEQVIFWQQLFYHITCSKLSLISVGGKPVSLKTCPFFITSINNPSTTWSLSDEVVTLHFNRWYKLSVVKFRNLFHSTPTTH